MFNDLLFTLWFFAPAGLANAAPIFAKNISWLDKFNKPIDAGKTYKNKRILGDHKTFRGVLSAVIIALITSLVQYIAATNSQWLQANLLIVDYTNSIFIIMGTFMGLGAIIGDGIKSFFKRQASVPSGKSWFPYDQIDYILGGLLFTLPFLLLPLQNYLYVLTLWFFLHIVSVYFGWLANVRKDPI